VVDDAVRYLRKISQKGRQFDVVIVDPPRGGLEGDFIHSLIALQPQRIVYVSCDPSTLARDLYTLQKVYDVKSLETFDLFGQTFHVETITLLSLKQP
jgi:tRNA/tmRNA/rRNA uracil-C5-methylase (TrmA/RlmC/RlmD family)